MIIYYFPISFQSHLVIILSLHIHSNTLLSSVCLSLITQFTPVSCAFLSCHFSHQCLPLCPTILPSRLILAAVLCVQQQAHGTELLCVRQAMGQDEASTPEHGGETP